MALRNRQTVNENNINIGESDEDGFFTLIVKSNASLYRGLFFIFIVLLFFVCAIWGIWFYVFQNPKIDKLVFENNNLKSIALQYEVKGKPCYIMNFHTSVLWEKLDVLVKPTDVINIKATGRYNTAIHHVIDAAISDSLPVFPWCSAKGIPSNTNYPTRLADLYRSRYRIDTGSNYGALLVQFVPKTVQNVPNRPAYTSMFAVGESNILEMSRFKSSEEGYLYFAVNEIPLNQDMENVYVITKNIDIGYEKRHPLKQQKKQWQYIKENQYWNLWYDDNEGSILIDLAIEKSENK